MAETGSTTTNDAPDGAARQRPRVQSAARAVGILLAIAESESGLTTKEISDRVEISRQATYHLLHTLAAAGMVARGDHGRYVLGMRVGVLAEGFKRQLVPAEHLAPIVRRLTQETGETAYASGWWNGEITTLTSARGTRPVQAADVPQGYSGHAHARASGKLLLAYAAPEVRDRLVGSQRLARVTPKTIVSRKALDDELEAIRERGYATDDEEFSLGLSCIAVPFEKGRSPFVLALSAPRERIVEHGDEYLETMRRLVAEVSGGPGADAA